MVCQPGLYGLNGISSSNNLMDFSAKNNDQDEPYVNVDVSNSVSTTMIYPSTSSTIVGYEGGDSEPTCFKQWDPGGRFFHLKQDITLHHLLHQLVESYARHYITAFAGIHRGNQSNEGIRIHLKGFATGNGLTDIAIRYKGCTDYALNRGIIKKATHDRLNK